MPRQSLTSKPNGPIPGENFTSDTRNYPWHRPPEYTDMDSMVIASMKQLTTKEATYNLLNTFQLGISVVQAATMFVISGVGAGKWAVDHAILLAGPVAKIMQIMADSAGIKYTMGLEDDPLPTIDYYKQVTKIDQESVARAQEGAYNAVKTIETPEEPVMSAGGGFAQRRGMM